MGVKYSQFQPDAFAGLVQSAATSNSYFVGDAYQLSWSLTSSSATASRWTIQGSTDDGFTAAVGASTWVDMQGATAPGLYGVSSSSMPRWVRWQRVPSASSSTVAFSYRVGA